MRVQNARRWAPHGARRWLVSAAALALASGAHALLQPLVGPIMPGTAYCIAAALVEYYFGLAPALVLMVTGLGLADYLFVPPYEQFGVLDSSDIALIVSYPTVTLLVISLIERLRRAQFRAELIASVAQSRYEMLLRADNDRLIARKGIDETQRLLRHLPHHHDDIILIRARERGAPRASVETAPGTRFAEVHPEDAQRLQNTLAPGTHRVRMAAGGPDYRWQSCVCERFTTHAGEFDVLRIAEEAGAGH